MLEDNWGHVGMDFPCVVGLLKSRVLLCSLSVSLSLSLSSNPNLSCIATLEIKFQGAAHIPLDILASILDPNLALI